MKKKKYTNYSLTNIEWDEEFKPHHSKQFTFSRQLSKIHGVHLDNLTIYYLIVKGVKLCKVTIDLKNYDKSRYYLNNNVKLDFCNRKYIKDFIQQKLTLKNSSIIKKLVNGGIISDTSLFDYASHTTGGNI